MMVHKRIKQVRELNRMTQADLAEKLGVTQSSVNDWETGVSTPSVQELMALAILFKVSADYILGLEDNVRVRIDHLKENEKEIVFAFTDYIPGQEDNARANIGHLNDDEKEIIFALLRTFEKHGSMIYSRET